MPAIQTQPDEQFEALRAENYNAQVVGLRRCHEDLMIVRVRPDAGIPAFEAGQYTVLGLGSWERRVPGVQSEAPAVRRSGTLFKRAYSISCRLIDERGGLVRPADEDCYEFYVTLVRFADADHPPAFTPRLFALGEGDRLFCGPHVVGHYTLHRVRPDRNAVFVATGTGEAPHNAMIAELLARSHGGRIVAVTCARFRQDLAYAAAHRRLEELFPNYRYLPLTTREPQNLDSSRADYIGKRYPQDYLLSGDLERDAGLELSPDDTHVFLCGSPEMIGVPLHTHHPQRRYPKPLGMVEVLERRGFRIDLPHEPGNIHFEKYW